MKNIKQWSLDHSSALYNVKHWSGGYVKIGHNGHLHASLQTADGELDVDLYELVNDIQQADMSLPCLVRFPDILYDRIRTLTSAFESAITRKGYHGRYAPVFPIKVNQEQSVVSEIAEFPDCQVGLEAGSKPELLTVLALSKPGSIIVCNGYKDKEYIRLALIGQQMGFNIFIVLEKPSELHTVASQSRALGIEPNIGIRVRLDSISNSKWQNTGGEKAKFGLSSSQVLHIIEGLKEYQLDHCLKLLHFHLGSQITNIDDIEKGINECARYYTELKQMGMRELDYVDVGGGLGIDYDGTRSRNYFSMNYNLGDYANTIVSTLQTVLDSHSIPHPTIITESGRAMVAHHAMLIVEVIESEHVIQPGIEKTKANHELVFELKKNLRDLEEKNRDIIEIYHNSQKISEKIKSSFSNGMLSLTDKAVAEQYYFALSQMIRAQLSDANKSHRTIIDELNERLADKYFCNFSLFQSIPDSWAINQIFPIIPLQRLNEAPTLRATIHDITCDSDGRINYYVDGEGTETSLPLHQLKPEDRYYLGIFLVGAYQEILGDMHNLFGDTNSVNVCANESGYILDKIHNGDSVEYVLQCVHYDTVLFLENYRSILDDSRLTSQQYELYYNELKNGLSGYTYLED